jgi:hypothetical protein
VSTIIGLVLSNGVSIASIVVATISALNGQEVLALLAALSGVITGLVGTYFGVKASSDARAGATQQRIKANKEASVRAKNNEQR